MPEISRDQTPECIKVSIAGQVTKCYIIPSMKEGYAYITAALAEAIKQTHAPTDKLQPNVWFPHQPKHVHVLDNSPGAQPARGGHRNWSTKLSKLASGTKIHDPSKGQRDYARTKAKREEAARCAAEAAETTSNTDIPQSDIEEPFMTTSETLSSDAPSQW